MDQDDTFLRAILLNDAGACSKQSNERAVVVANGPATFLPLIVTGKTARKDGQTLN